LSQVAVSYLQEMFPAPNRRCAADASARCRPSHICKNHFASFAFCLLCASERTRSAGGLCVMGWGHGFGLIAILIEEVGLGSDDGCSFNKIGATSHDQTIFANTSQSFTPAHDRRHERVGISR
jgi:hypothetical protein